MALEEYNRKRDFSKTTEPRGGEGSADKPIFVIQKHDASRMHYDFRLEIDGTLKSWSVPKGPSTNPEDKRLAIPTEDHPLDYADFEGTIPEGEYGGGTVMVWDRGTFENKTKKNGAEIEPAEGLDAGELVVYLKGEKLRGGYALVRFREDEDQWLLIKKDDAEADRERDIITMKPDSVVTGRSLEEIAKESS